MTREQDGRGAPADILGPRRLIVSYADSPWPRLLALLALGAALLAATAPAYAAVPTPGPAPGRAQGPAGAGGPGQVAGSSRSAVSGSVLLDEDLDGSPSRGDRPLVGVPVRIAGPGVNTGAATDGGGSFAFGGLPAGTYTVSIGLPGGLVSLSGTSRAVSVNGSGSARADFFAGRPERAPVPTTVPPTPTPLPPMPTSTPKPLPTPAPAPGFSPSGPAGPAPPGARGGPGAGGRQPAAGYQGAPRAAIASAQGPRYAPGRGHPTAIRPVRKDAALWLGVPFMSQIDGTTYADVNCGPASTAMILSAFGIRATPAAVRNYVNHISGVYSAGVGTSLDHLGRVLRESGLEMTDLYRGGRYLRWSTALLREHVQAGHPVMTLVKYRALPGHGGSIWDFDHYIVISGLAGDDFIYNDAAYASDRGYGLLISPRDLERAWDYSSIPRHSLAVSLPAGAGLAPPDDEASFGGRLLGGEFSDEDLLAAADASLGEELSFLDSFGDLTFRRVLVDGEAAVELAANGGGEGEGTLELAGFVPVDGDVAGPSPLVAGPPAQLRVVPPALQSSPPLVAVTGQAVLLGGLAVGLLGLGITRLRSL